MQRSRGLNTLEARVRLGKPCAGLPFFCGFSEQSIGGECREAAALSGSVLRSSAPGAASRLPGDRDSRHGRTASADPFWVPRAMDGSELAGKILYTWMTLVLGFILLPSAFGVSLGISQIYMKILVKTLECFSLGTEVLPLCFSVLSAGQPAPANFIEWTLMLEDAGGAMDKLCAWDHLALLPLSIWKAAFSAEDSTLEEHGFRPLQKVQEGHCLANSPLSSSDTPPTVSSSTSLKLISDISYIIQSFPYYDFGSFFFLVRFKKFHYMNANGQIVLYTCIIQRDESPMEKGLSGLRGRDFELSDVFYFSKKGLEAIVEDEVTQRFSSEELVSWNLLTRTNVNFQYISPRLTVVWVLGVLVRYCILLPLRQYKPQKGGICVANHTSPIDVLILTMDGCYAMVGQVHGGLLGIIQRAMVKACPHVWFERSEMKDRHLVTQRLREHIADKKKLPILIFPEGTCINNTSVMMFKKGSFEIGGTIHPVAIKYNPQFGDAFWNSSKYNMVSYLLRMMTSWAIVCDVWYMPPMTREKGEDAVQFANRVKSAIAVQGGLTELPWDGGLKRAKVKDTFKEEQQKNYSKMIVGNGSLNSEAN
ncbi:1-acylglycerol-3-phosphate O-acyltransferase 9 [Camelus ferus]|nr:1-acylglycerol-3-phosphate O-acyltransferase 9 [Camelus ferus]